MARIGVAELRTAFNSTDAWGRRKYTYKTLGRKIGVSYGHVWRIINGKIRRDTKARRKIIAALGLEEEARA